VQRGETADPVDPPALAGSHAPTGTGAYAGLGTAGSLGSLSVPANWAIATPQTEPVPDSSSANCLDATAAVTAGSSRGRTFQHGLMTMLSGFGAMTHATENNKGEKDDEPNENDDKSIENDDKANEKDDKNNTEAQYAEMPAQDAAAMYDYAAASSAANTLTPFSEPPQTTTHLAGDGDEARLVAQAAGNAISAHTQSPAQLSSPTAPRQVTATTAAPQASATAAGVTVTVGDDYPVYATADVNVTAVTNTTYAYHNSHGQLMIRPIHAGQSYTTLANGRFMSGTFTYLHGGALTTPSGPITGAPGGADVTVVRNGAIAGLPSPRHAADAPSTSGGRHRRPEG
jgi:hypothetical protein